jgi:hypothetical protein
MHTMLVLFANGVAHHNPFALWILGFWVCLRYMRVVVRPGRRIPRRDRDHYVYRSHPAAALRPGSSTRSAGPAEWTMPAPSERLADADQPCRHDKVVGVDDALGTRIRYACANWRCLAVWPPDTEWPAGMVLPGEPGES